MSIKKMTNKVSKVRGFTLLEILLVVGIIAILAGIVILAINPTKQLGDTRNTQRRADVLTILNAIYQYSIDNNGTVPDTILDTGNCEDVDNTIAVDENFDDDAPIDLYSTLVTDEATYIVSIPIDPLAATSSSSGYGVVKDPDSDRVTVCAPLAEQDETISVTR